MDHDKDKEMGMKKLEEDNKAMGAKLGQLDKLMADLEVDSIEDLMKMISKLREENGSLMEDKEMSEKKNKLNKLFSEGKITKAQQDKALELKGDAFEGFISMAEMNEKVVKMSESGNNETPSEESESDEDVQDKVIELAEKKVKENEGMSFQEATSQVLSENPKLAEKYGQLI